MIGFGGLGNFYRHRGRRSKGSILDLSVWLGNTLSMRKTHSQTLVSKQSKKEDRLYRCVIHKRCGDVEDDPPKLQWCWEYACFVLILRCVRKNKKAKKSLPLRKKKEEGSTVRESEFITMLRSVDLSPCFILAEVSRLHSWPLLKETGINHLLTGISF